jgi:glyoxylase-like metal-dependent hydrolase (beta-lactamase superfamily II)
MWVYAVWNDQNKILVDTGIHDKDWIIANRGPVVQSKEETLQAAVKRGVKWALEDVDTVINTHLHYDHVGGNQFVPNAKFYVQKTEWEYAFNPFKTHKALYIEELYGPETINHFRWNFVEGDVDLLPGIRLITTPGHSAGHQTVLVDTDEGVVCITGDAASMLQNFSAKTLNGSSIKISEVDSYDSIDKIARSGNFVCPGHDPNIRNFQTSGFPRIRDLQNDALPLEYPELQQGK